jgi:hypothetical protein
VKRPTIGMGGERRRNTRRFVNALAVLRDDIGPPREARVLDLSLTGAFVYAEPLPAFNSKIRLDIQLTAGTVSIEATVRWNKPDGCGVQFVSLGARETFMITEYIAGKERVPDTRDDG